MAKENSDVCACIACLLSLSPSIFSFYFMQILPCQIPTNKSIRNKKFDSKTVNI